MLIAFEDIQKVEAVQFSLGPDMSKSELKESHGVGIIFLRIE